jgi:hypothetical protein
MVYDEINNVEADMEVVNRCAMVIKPNEPYLGWANRTATSYETPEDMAHTAKVILLPSSVFEDPETFLARHARELFEMELEAWLPDKRKWPAVRDSEVFQKWFEVTFHALVVDYWDADLIKEPWG